MNKLIEWLEKGNAVRCEAPEEAEKLFEIMGWKHVAGQINPFSREMVNTMTYKIGAPSSSWSVMPNYFQPSKLFSALYQEPSNLIKALWAVRSELKKWLFDGVEFMYGDIKYVINGGVPFQVFDTTLRQSNFLHELLKHPEKIKAIPKYSQETIEAAKKDSFRFTHVARDGDGDVLLFQKKPSWNDVIDGWSVAGGYCLRIPVEQYPEVKPRECVKLEEIVRCGE